MSTETDRVSFGPILFFLIGALIGILMGLLAGCMPLSVQADVKGRDVYACVDTSLEARCDKSSGSETWDEDIDARE